MSDVDADTDIMNYTVDDILEIFNISEPTVFNVTDVANSLIAKMKTEDKADMMNFFTQARDKVLEYLQSQLKEPVENETTEKIKDIWKKYSFTDDGDPANKTQYFDDGSHITAQQKTIIPVNSAPPILASRVVVVNSQFRSSILPYSNNPLSNTFNTNFTFNLSSPILKAVSMKLYSYQIPTTWYSFNALAGNTFFLYNGVMINIPDGNYNPTTLVTAIMAAAALNIATNGLIVTYNSTTNRIAFENSNPLLDTVSVIFFIQSNTVNFTSCGSFILSNFQTLSINTTLGWLLGFRPPINTITGDVEISLPPNIVVPAEAAPDTYGPKYFTLSIEDYRNTRLSGGLYNITNTKQYSSLSVQDYFNTVEVDCKLREGALTQAQLYTINAVILNNNKINKTRNTAGNNSLVGPTGNSVFAVIPLAGINRPEPYIKFGVDLTVNVRNYNKPTNIERLRVSLSDDKGNLVNLYDNDWSFTLIIDERLN